MLTEMAILFSKNYNFHTVFFMLQGATPLQIEVLRKTVFEICVIIAQY